MFYKVIHQAAALYLQLHHVTTLSYSFVWLYNVYLLSVYTNLMCAPYTLFQFRLPVTVTCNVNKKAQLSLTNPRDAKACQKLLPFDVLTTLSLTILAYLHSFSCCCVRNLRNPAKFTKNSNIWSSRSSKVIDLGVNRKPICDFILVINSNFSRICYRFRDIHG